MEPFPPVSSAFFVRFAAVLAEMLKRTQSPAPMSPHNRLIPFETMSLHNVAPIVLGVLASIVACKDLGPTRPTESPPVEVISVGEQVSGTFTGLSRYFDLVAPKNGTLVAALTWNGSANGTVLVLDLNGTKIRPAAPGRFGMHVTGRLQVAAGQTIRVAVLAGGSDVTYDDPFVLGTTLE